MDEHIEQVDSVTTYLSTAGFCERFEHQNMAIVNDLMETEKC